MFLIGFRYGCYYLMFFVNMMFYCIDVIMQLYYQFSDLPPVHSCYGAGHYDSCFTDVTVQNNYLFYFQFCDLPPVHWCCGAGSYDSCCTYVTVQNHYWFIFSSGMDCNNPSHRCGRLYFPIFLFNVGLFTLMYMASFNALAILWSSLPIILKFSTDVMWPVLFWCSCMGDGVFRCSLYLSSNVLDDSPIYSSSQSILSHLNQYITLLFLLMVSLSLGDTSKFLGVFLPLKYTCIPYFLQMFLKLSAIPLEYGTTMWLIFFCVTGCCFFLFVLECVCVWMIFCIAHLAYLQPINAFSKCSNSCLVESGVEHSVLALCVRVLITLYLEAKLWLLSHWRYWSVWVGFLYTFVVNVPSVSGVMSRSKNGMEPFGPASSMVNVMDVSTWLMWWKNSSLCDSNWTTKVSSTYLFHIFGGCSAVLRALSSKASI